MRRPSLGPVQRRECSLPAVTQDADYVDPKEALQTVDRHLSAHQPHMTACCAAGGVASSCAGLCDLDHMFHASPAATAPLLARCSAHLAAVFSCLADGRDHAPCCLDSGVPELCADFCSGDLAPSNLTSTSASTQCAPYTRQVVGCVAIGKYNNIHITYNIFIIKNIPTPGVATIPRAPEEVSVTAENDTSVTVSWARALGPDTARTLDHYTVNLTFVTYVSLPSTIYCPPIQYCTLSALRPAIMYTSHH